MRTISDFKQVVLHDLIELTIKEMGSEKHTSEVVFATSFPAQIPQYQFQREKKRRILKTRFSRPEPVLLREQNNV